MASLMRNWFLTALIIFVLVGCAGGGDGVSPDTESETTYPIELTAGREVSGYEGNHYLLFHNLVYIDTTNPDAVEFEIVPLREGFMHLNILMFLEVAPCTDCFKIVGLNYPEPGVLDVDIEITHPFSDPDYTCFDLRSIVMFNGNHTFIDSGLTMSDPSLGDGALLNAEGFTTHYNTWQIGNPQGNLQKYFPGKLATQNLPDSMVNGYIRHISDNPSNTRNALYAGDSVTRTYSLKLPEGEAVLGYAVDANWAPPIESPVDDPMTDFGPNASSPEPWKIVVMETPIGEGLTDEGGETNLTIDIYDWQGIGSHAEPVIECTELFTGTLSAALQAEFGDFTRYQAIIGNSNLAGGGYYNCLISVQDKDYNPNFPWLDLKAYQVISLRVTGRPIASASLDPLPQEIGQPVHFDGSSSYDPDGGGITLYEWDWDLDGIYDETGVETDHTWDSGGVYYVQLRVTDDEGLTDELNTPLEVVISKPGIPLYPVEITPPLLSLSPSGFKIYGDYLYFVNEADGLYILNISDPANPVFDNCVAYKSRASWLLDVVDGYAYVYYSPYFWEDLDDGIYIIDITDPSEAFIAGNLEIDNAGSGAAKDGYLYFTGGLGHAKIIDVEPPGNPHITGTLASGNNIVIASDYLYIQYTYYDSYWPYLNGNFITIYDATVPGNPVGIGKHELGYYGSSSNYPYIAGLSNNLFVCRGGNFSILEVALTGEVTHIDGVMGVCSGKTWIDPAGVAFTTNINGTTLIDIDPVEDAQVVNTLNGATDGDSLNGITLLYSRHSGGINHRDPWIQLWDTDPPETAQKLYENGWIFDTDQLVISGNYAYVGEDSDGILYILDIFDLENTHIINKVKLGNNSIYSPYDLQIAGNYLLEASTKSLRIIDISDPYQAEVVKVIGTQNNIRSIAVSDGFAFLGNDEAGLTIVDIDPVDSAFIVDTINIPGTVYDVVLSGGYAYVSTGFYGGLVIIDIDPLEEAHIVNELDNRAYRIEYSNGYIIQINTKNADEASLKIVDVDPPELANVVKTIDIQVSELHTLAVYGQYAFMGAGYSETNMDAQLYIFDIFPPEDAHIVTTIDTWDAANESVVVDDKLFLTTGEGGLRIYDLW